ncbi:AsmA family protein [Lutibacter sp. HS1-25]|uniref:AsmA-like C-terminal region-containing protein n=1 Tax=Lutibacter sp. HS1-25 TaxID=2485000 RepID=UPI001011D541|nr:AsmA-like C-terminal region-containing protein [Lutibacter sp. HS1-25]RXP56176.1 AsmA family protein [Lutibacter sp. HS1-25]
MKKINFKKVAKILAIVLLLFVITLVAAPFLFKDKIKAAVLTAVNENLTAKVAFEDVDLSFFRSFPQASVILDHLSIINNAPFENDTLMVVSELGLSMSVKELFKGENEAINISAIKINGACLNFISNVDGIANYDIVKPSENESDSESGSFNFSVEKYEITNSTILYKDEVSKINLMLRDFNHSGSGDLSAKQSKLDTKSSVKLSFQFEEVKYFENAEITLDALIGVDLETNTYSFLQNEANISGLPLAFDGNVVLLDAGQQIDISFKTPTSSFKNFLALMPKVYASNLDNVKTEGDFTVSGFVKGMNNDDRIPNFDLNIASNNAWFKYADLPKAVENITIKALIKNETGIVADTYVILDALNFKIDEDVFKSNANIKNLTTNPVVNAKLNGTINLANISNAYPFEMKEKLSGILKMDIATNFDMDAVEKSKYERIKSSGNITLSNFVYNGAAFVNSFNIKTASVNFTPQVISLQQFAATTGKTDIEATGSLQDVIGFVVANKPLKGNFNLVSNKFSVNDFMSDVAVEQSSDTLAKSAIKIPAFLDCTIAAQANTVLYDHFELKNFKGKMTIKDEKVNLENVTSSLLGGNLMLNGSVSTKEATPSFTMNLGMNSFDIASSFEKMDLLKKLIPMAKYIQGKLNTELSFSGDLDSEFSPNLKTVSGNAFAELLTREFDLKSSVLMNTLSSQLKFIDLNKLDLKNLKTTLVFEKGRVLVKPFTINYQDIAIDISGTHGFDMSMDYNATFLVPAKYLGNEVTGLLAKYSTEDVSKVKVPVNAIIGGNFDKPKITTDYKSAVSSLTTQLVDVNKLKAQGVSTITNLLKQQTEKSTETKSDSVATPSKAPVSNQQKVVDSLLKVKLNSLFSGKKKKKDTIK